MIGKTDYSGKAFAPKRQRHEVQRLKQRTKLGLKDLTRLRRRLRLTTIPSGVHHVKMPDGSYAVIKTVGKRAVVASFLTPAMAPPGRDVTALIYKKPKPISVRRAYTKRL